MRGNNDKGSWASSLPTTEVLTIGETLIYVVHDLADLDLDPGAAGFQAVVSGHSHRPRCESRNGVVFVNPGSAGPRRFHLPVAVARLVVSPARIEPQLLELRVTAPASNGHRRPRAAQRGSS